MTDETKSFTPPYPPFKTFTNFLEGLEAKQEQFPPKIDRSYLRLDGATQSQLLAALRGFELIDEDGNVLDALKELATSPDDRPQLVAGLVRRYYPEMVDLGERNATQQMLEDAFAAHGLTGSTRRKAISFFLKAAEWGGVALSPHFTTPRAGTATANGRRRRTKRQEPDPPSMPPPKASTDAKDRYIDLLLKKAEQEMDDKLLDRIERVIGVQHSEQSTEEAAVEN